MKHRVLPLLLALCASAVALPVQARGDVGVSIAIHDPGLRGRVDIGPSWRHDHGPVLVVPGPVIVERGRWEPVRAEGWRPAYREWHRHRDHHRGHWDDRDDRYDAPRGWRHARWHHDHERCREEGPRTRVYLRAGD